MTKISKPEDSKFIVATRNAPNQYTLSVGRLFDSRSDAEARIREFNDGFERKVFFVDVTNLKDTALPPELRPSVQLLIDQL